MAVAETLATGVQAAIGSKFPSSGNRLLYASFYGSLGAIDLNTRVLSFLGGGYSNPEDVAIASISNHVYMTERAGNLLLIDMANPDRAHATRLVTGLMAPQQIALSADEKTAFVIEFNPVAPARLLQFDLTISPPGMIVVRNDVQAGVGVVYDDASLTKAVYITEQAGTGTLTRIDTGVAGAPRTLIADHLPAPFFLSWLDAAHTKLLVPQRDPYNRIDSVDLTATPAPVRRVLDGVPFRPSSVTVMPSGHLIVCSDREITDYDLSAGPVVAESRGLGAGGSLYCPVVCPTNTQELLISCDMGGLYRSTNQGRTWVLQDGRSVKAGTAVSAAYDPLAPATMVSTHVVSGLVTGTAVGNRVTWAPLIPPLAGITGDQVQGLAFTPDGKSLIVATSKALHRLDRNTSTWSSVSAAFVPAGGSVLIGDLISVVSPGPGAPGGRCFAADNNYVYWSDDHGATWWAIVPAAGQLPTPGRIRGLATGIAGANTVVYATASTIDDAFTGAGVYRLQLSAAAVPNAPPAWSNVSAGLTKMWVVNPQPPPTHIWPQYDVLATPLSAADTVYVGMPTGMAFGPPSWTIWKGQWNPASSVMVWRGAFDGFTVQTADHNVEPGWIDLKETDSTDPKPQPALGFGFGGPPHGIGCAASTGDVTLQTNEAFADLTTSGAPNTAAGWRQCYTLPVQTFSGQRWRTTGLDVTNVWSYRIHPDPAKGSIHFLANTDIALSRSDDAGDTWQLIYPHRVGTFWGNFYELEFNSATGEIWAAVSVEHDLPYSGQLDWELDPTHTPGAGAVLRSVDDGLTWSELGSSLPDSPVLSVGYGGTPASLYAAVWRKGVYQLQAGNIWQPVGNIGGGLRARRLAFDKTGNLFALTSGIDQGAGLYKWTGATWTPLTTALISSFYPLGKFYPFDFYIDPVKPNSYWLCTVGVQGGSDGAVYKSDDGGSTWTVIFSYSSMGGAGPKYQSFLHCTAVTFDPNDSTGLTVYVTTETHGIWYSIDRGASWQEFTPIPFMATQRITFDPHDVGTVYIATKGGGGWRTMSAAKASSIHQAVRRHAYALYQRRGSASGHAFDDWVAAYHATMDATIRTRAYELAQLRNFSGAHAVDDWLQAEQEALRALLI